MNLEKVILDQFKKKNELKIADIVKKTGFSRIYVHRFFKRLRDKRKIILVGKTNQAIYILATKENIIKKPLFIRRNLTNKNLSEDIVLENIKKETAIFKGLKKNIIEILDYAFTEMLNNAIEHSKSKKILAQMARKDERIKFSVIDSGIGIFSDIKKKFKLKNILEAINLLLKGKQTIAPETHTGEGIFFTSKIADKFIIASFNKKLIFDNQIDDIFVKDIKKIKGTKVIFEISAFSKTKLVNVFKEYTSENFVFNKTKVKVKLLELGGESYISRSEARRLLFGLEKFQRVILDFKKVETIGQAFSDEVFRVWQKKNSKINIERINSNENIEFMIKRALKSS